MPHKVKMPAFIALPELATYLGVCHETARSWVSKGLLPASRLPTHHYADDRPRVTGRGSYRIYREDLKRFLRGFRGGQIRLPRMRRK